MKFNFFHTMPWPYFQGVPETWPVPNTGFDGERGHELYKDYIKTFLFAEQCGFDWIACNEHHYSPFSLMPNCNLVGSVLAMQTRNCKVAIAGNLLPLLNPIRVAEEYAMLDVMSGGRMVAGFFRGIPHEYLAYNINPSEAHGRMREATELIVKAWTATEPFAWDGEFYKFPSVSIWPKPYQKPYPQLLMSTTNPESSELAAKFRAIVGLVFVHDLEWAHGLVQAYRETAKAHGWEPTRDHFLVGEHTVIADTDEEALEIMKKGHDYLHRVLMRPQREAQRMVIENTRFYYQKEPGETMQAKLYTIRSRTVEDSIEAGSIICGSPATVTKQLKRISQTVGNGVFSLNFKVGDVPETTVRHGLKLFRDKVLPELRNA